MSELGNLSQCMVDSDAAAKARASRLRRKALAASVIIEAMVIPGVLLWPLATLGVLPAQLALTPVPPYRGDQARRSDSRPAERRAAIRSPIAVDILRQPPVIPPHVATGPDPEPPGLDLGDSAPGGPGGLVPGGNETGQTIEIARPLRPQNKPLKMSEGVMSAQIVVRVQPEYPAIAKAMRLSGTVVLRATIGTDGEVHAIEVVSGHPILAKAACDAVRQWRYRPTLLSGQAVEVETQITVHFVLD